MEDRQNREEEGVTEEAPAPQTEEAPSVSVESENRVVEPLEAATPAPAKEVVDVPVQSTGIMSLAIRTAFLTFAVLILLFSCFLNFVPYRAMQFYDHLGNRSMAFYAAEKYVARHEKDAGNDEPAPFGKYADALYYCNGAAIYFFNESLAKNGFDNKNTKYYARKLDKYTTRYLGNSLILDTLSERTARVDAYNLLHTAPALHPYVYSYADSLEIMRFKADYALKNETMPAWRTGDPSRNENVTYANYWYGQFVADITTWQPSNENWSVASEADDGLFLMLAQLNEYLKAELDAIGFYNIKRANPKYPYPTASDVGKAVQNDGYNLYGLHPFAYFMDEYGKFLELYESITYRMPAIKDYLKANAHTYADNGNALEHLKFTYYLKTFADFTRSMWHMTSVLSRCYKYFDEVNRTTLQKSESTYNNLFQISGVRLKQDDGSWKTDRGDLDDWYERGMLSDYLDLYKKPTAQA